MQKWDGFMLNLDSCGGAQCQKWQELFALGRYRGWEIWSICYSDHFSDGRKQGSQLNHVPFSLSFQATKSNLAQTNGSGHGTHFFQYLWWLIHWIIPYIIWFQYCRDNLQENLYLAETHGFRSGTRVVLQEARYHHLQNCFGYVEESSNHGEVVGMATLFMAPGMVTGGSSQVSKIIHLTSKRLISVFIVISGSCSRMGTSRVQESMGWTATVWWAGSGQSSTECTQDMCFGMFSHGFPMSIVPLSLPTW